MGGKVHKLKSKSEFKAWLSPDAASKRVVIDFFATWCPPCRMIGPVFEEFSKKYGSKVSFLKVDVDEVRAVAQKCGIGSMPTFQGYYKGKLVGEVVGADRVKVEALIQRIAEIEDDQIEDDGEEGEADAVAEKKKPFWKRVFA